MNNNFEIVRDALSITINFANFSTVDSNSFMPDSEKVMIEVDEAIQKHLQQVINQFDHANGWAAPTLRLVGSQNKTIYKIKSTFLDACIDVNTTCDFYAGKSTATIEWDTPDDYLEETVLDQYIDQLYNHLEKEDIIWYCNDTANEIVYDHTIYAPEDKEDSSWDHSEASGYYYNYVDQVWVPIDKASDDVKFRHKYRVLDAKEDDPLKQFVLGKDMNVA